MNAMSRNNRTGMDGTMGVPNGQVFAGGLRVMHSVLHVKRINATGANTHCSDGDSQGKNARQSHP